MKSSFLNGMLLTALAPLAHAINYIDILPGNHDVLITRVTYEVDGEIVVQDAPAMGVAVSRNAPVYLKSVTIDARRHAATRSTATTRWVRRSPMSASPPPRAASGFSTTDSRPGPATWMRSTTALAATTQDTDLMNYAYYDHVSHMPAPGVADYDLLFQRGFKTDDYLLVSERWGNTYFTLTPLDASGEVIIGANTLRFGYPTGDAYTKYDWNSGYAASSYVERSGDGLHRGIRHQIFRGQRGGTADGLRFPRGQ